MHVGVNCPPSTHTKWVWLTPLCSAQICGTYDFVSSEKEEELLATVHSIRATLAKK